jgi:hypothetical protein
VYIEITKRRTAMAEDKFSEYTQGLYDTVIALRKEVDNLRTGYSIIHNRIDAIITLADKNTKDALKEAIDIEELARLAVVAAAIAHKAAVILIETGAIEKTKNTLEATEKTYTSAQAYTVENQARKTAGGFPNS